MDKEKAYIITLKFGIVQKRVWFMGENNAQGEQSFREACISLNEIGDTCTKWPEFFSKAIEHFKKYGFEWIKG